MSLLLPPYIRYFPLVSAKFGGLEIPLDLPPRGEHHPLLSRPRDNPSW